MLAHALIRKNRVPLAETALASQPNRQHDKIAAKPRAPSQMEGFVEQHTYKCIFKASNAPVDPRQVEKVTVTVKLHADDSAADGNRAVTSKVNRPAISPVVNVGVAAARRPSAGKVGSPKTGKKLFLAKGLIHDKKAFLTYYHVRFCLNNNLFKCFFSFVRFAYLGFWLDYLQKS